MNFKFKLKVNKSIHSPAVPRRWRVAANAIDSTLVFGATVTLNVY